MANVLNRTSKQYLKSVNTPDFPVSDWIVDPDLSAVNSFPNKYWVISGDVVSLMDQAARSAVDAAELEAQITAEKTEEKDEFDTKRVLKAFAEPASVRNK